MNTSASDTDAVAGRTAMARIDAAGWGIFFVWVGVALEVNIGWGIALTGTGLIALGTQVAHRLQDLPVDRWSIGVGGCLLMAGLSQWLHIPSDKVSLPGWVVPAIFVAIGIAILVRAWRHGHPAS